MGMTQKLSIEELKNVPETLLYPLKARYIETKKKGGVISDPLSVKILDTLQYDPSQTKIAVMPQLGMCLRTIIFDTKVNRFLAENPDGVVVNIACGLDTRQVWAIHLPYAAILSLRRWPDGTTQITGLRT